MAAEVNKLTDHKVVQEVVVEGPTWGGSQASDYFHIAERLRKDLKANG